MYAKSQYFKLANGLYSQSQSFVMVPKASESESVALRDISQIVLACVSHGWEPHWFSELDVAHLSGGSWCNQCEVQTLNFSGRGSGF